MKFSKQKLLIYLATVVCSLSVIIMGIVLCIPKQQRGEFVPPSFDGSATVGTPVVADVLGWQELDAKVYKVGVCGKVILTGDSADVWLTNPPSNAVWLKLRVLDEKGNILGETGLIKPNEYVRSVVLDRIPQTDTPIALKIMAYQPDTYYSEGTVTLNTTISDGGRK